MTSRRDRPAKAPLTRAGIIDAALVILREEGLAKVTMRRIAGALDTGAASLYVYVRDTEDLHAQILDALLGSVKGKKGGDWRLRLKALLVGYRGVLFQHPQIAQMALSTQPSGPNYLRLVDDILALLAEGGMSDAAAAWAVDLLLLYPTAIAAERGGRPPGQTAAEMSSLAQQIETVSADAYPQIARLGHALLSGPGVDRFDWALDVVLNGALVTTPGATTRKAKR